MLFDVKNASEADPTDGIDWYCTKALDVDTHLNICVGPSLSAIAINVSCEQLQYIWLGLMQVMLTGHLGSLVRSHRDGKHVDA